MTQSTTDTIVFLIVDDDEEDRDDLSAVLRQLYPHGVQLFAGNGKEAIKKLSGEEKADVIFLDLNMPIMNGVECLTYIKSQTSMQDIPVVIYSTSGYGPDIERTKALGATAYLTKQTSLRALPPLIMDVLSRIFPIL